jgi:hypothetical protein
VPDNIRPSDLILRIPSQPPAFLTQQHDARPCTACLPETSLSQAAEVCHLLSKVEGDKVRLGLIQVRMTAHSHKQALGDWL